ncbi:DJ-1/PfpI family protein [Malacoplasma muris]|uniref:DJ-1/PfpI family protein n=1 Tax=Malacoplasma muris TaxID=2119 RepID=UPI00398EB7B4
MTIEENEKKIAVSNVRIAIMVANESEDIEVLAPYDLWRRAGLIVELVSVEKKNTIILQSGAKMYCNSIIERTNLDQFHAIYLPGGRGHTKFLEEKYSSDKLIKTLRKFANEQNKWLLAMCASPSILGILSVLGNSKATAYPGFEKSLGKNYVDEGVVASGNVITGKSVAYAIEFSLLVIEKLLDKKTRNSVAKEILYVK